MKYNPTIHHRHSIRLKGYDYSQAGLYYITICTQNREHLFGKISVTVGAGPRACLNPRGCPVRDSDNLIDNDECIDDKRGRDIHNNENSVNEVKSRIITNSRPFHDGTIRQQQNIDNPGTIQGTHGGVPLHTIILSDAGRMVEKIWNEIPEYYNGFNVHEFVVMPNHIHGIIEIVGASPRGCPNDVCGCHAYDKKQNIRYPEIIGRPQGGALTIPDIIHRFKTLTTKRYTDGVKEHGWTPFPGRLWQRNYYEHIIRDEQSYYRISEYIINNPLNWQGDDYFDK